MRLLSGKFEVLSLKGSLRLNDGECCFLPKTLLDKSSGFSFVASLGGGEGLREEGGVGIPIPKKSNNTTQV